MHAFNSSQLTALFPVSAILQEVAGAAHTKATSAARSTAAAALRDARIATSADVLEKIEGRMSGPHSELLGRGRGKVGSEQAGWGGGGLSSRHVGGQMSEADLDQEGGGMGEAAMGYNSKAAMGHNSGAAIGHNSEVVSRSGQFGHGDGRSDSPEGGRSEAGADYLVLEQRVWEVWHGAWRWVLLLYYIG